MELDRDHGRQPEILEYANHVADRFDLRDDIKFQTRVVSTVFDESCSRWKVKTDRGRIHGSILRDGNGMFVGSNTPSIDGQEEFAGPVYHTGNWPKVASTLAIASLASLALAPRVFSPSQ